MKLEEDDGAEGIGEGLWIEAVDAYRTRPAHALALLRTLLTMRPGDWGTNALHAEVLIGLSRYEEALAILAPMRAMFSGPGAKAEESEVRAVLLALGRLYAEWGQREEAVNIYRELTQRFPEDSDGYIYGGGVLTRMGKLTEAEATYRRATECEEGCIDEAFLNLGFVLRAQERYEEARRCFERAIELDAEYEAAKLALDDLARAASASAHVPGPRE